MPTKEALPGYNGDFREKPMAKIIVLIG